MKRTVHPSTVWRWHGCSMSRTTRFADLLAQAGKKTVTVRAFGAPFEAKDALKTRGYRWHDGTTGPNRHWWKEIAEEEVADEKIFWTIYIRTDPTGPVFLSRRLPNGSKAPDFQASRFSDFNHFLISASA